MIQAVGHTSNGGQIGLKGLIVCNDIDASCKTRDDNRIRLPRTSDQFTTNLFPLRITRSGTNDADELTLTKIEVSLIKQNQGGIGTKSKCFGVVVIAQKQGFDVVFIKFFFGFVNRIGIVFPAFKELNMSCSYALWGLEIPRRSLKNGLRTAAKVP